MPWTNPQRSCYFWSFFDKSLMSWTFKSQDVFTQIKLKRISWIKCVNMCQIDIIQTPQSFLLFRCIPFWQVFTFKYCDGHHVVSHWPNPVAFLRPGFANPWSFDSFDVFSQMWNFQSWLNWRIIFCKPDQLTIAEDGKILMSTKILKTGKSYTVFINMSWKFGPQKCFQSLHTSVDQLWTNFCGPTFMG